MSNEYNMPILSFESDLTPKEYIDLMFDRTDENGILYMYELPCDSLLYKERTCKYSMSWNLKNCVDLCSEFDALYKNIVLIAQKYNLLDKSEETAKAIFLDQMKNIELFDTWQTFIKPLYTIDETTSDISNRIDMIDYLKELSCKFAKDAELTKDEKDFFREYMDVSVTKDEKRFYDSYCKSVVKEAEKRVGTNIYAYEYIIRAARLCRLFSLNAPEIVIKNEARLLAVTMALHKYCVSENAVDSACKVQTINNYECMSDEELDDLFRPKKTNSRKSMAPLFVYLILKEHSDKNIHLRQQEILAMLENYPYEVTLERKALSRIIHNLTDSQLSVFSDKSGTWQDDDED